MKTKLLFLLTSYISISATKFPEIFSTERMNAHKIQPHDIDNLYLLLSNPQVAETILGGVHSFDKTEKVLELLLQRWNTHNYGSFMFHDKQTKSFIGRAGLHPACIDGKNEIILSYAIIPEYWNKGFATEMAQSLVKIAFEHGEFESIVCFTQLTNKASRRVIEKSGFNYEKIMNETIGVYKDVHLIFYRLSRNTDH